MAAGVVMAAVGIKMYEVQCDNGGLWKRHSDQIRANPVGLELKDSLSSRELSNHVDITTGAHSRAVQPCPSATDEPRPSATNEPCPSTTEAVPDVSRQPSICPDPRISPELLRVISCCQETGMWFYACD